MLTVLLVWQPRKLSAPSNRNVRMSIGVSIDAMATTRVSVGVRALWPFLQACSTVRSLNNSSSAVKLKVVLRSTRLRVVIFVLMLSFAWLVRTVQSTDRARSEKNE